MGHGSGGQPVRSIRVRSRLGGPGNLHLRVRRAPLRPGPARGREPRNFGIAGEARGIRHDLHDRQRPCASAASNRHGRRHAGVDRLHTRGVDRRRGRRHRGRSDVLGAGPRPCRSLPSHVRGSGVPSSRRSSGASPIRPRIQQRGASSCAVAAGDEAGRLRPADTVRKSSRVSGTAPHCHARQIGRNGARRDRILNRFSNWERNPSLQGSSGRLFGSCGAT